MVEALRRAVKDCGTDAVVDAVDSVPARRARLRMALPQPARLVAQRLGCPDAATVATNIGGNVPQMVVNGACRDIATGDAEVVLVTGAEAGRSKGAAPARRHRARLDGAG